MSSAAGSSVVSLLHDQNAASTSSDLMPPHKKPKNYEKLKRLYAVPQQNGKVIVRFADAAVDIYFQNINSFNLPESFLLSLLDLIQDIIVEYLPRWGNMKMNLLLECTFTKLKLEKGIEGQTVEDEELIDANFKTKNEVLSSTTDILDYLLRSFERIIEELDSFESKGSGWALKSIDGLLIRLTKYSPLSASCNFPLPENIIKSKSIISVKNNDNLCFKYAILCWYLKNNSETKKLDRASVYKNLAHPFNFEGIQFPSSFRDVTRFEKQNSRLCSINIYALNELNELYPLHISPRVNTYGVPTIDLLFLENELFSHYCTITNLPALVNSQIRNDDHSCVMCRKCFKMYRTSYVSVDGKNAHERLRDHAQFCNQFKACRYEFPEKLFLEFDEYQFMTKVGFVFYGDLECKLVPLDCDMMGHEAEEPSTKHMEKHVPTCSGFHLKSYYPQLLQDETFLYSGKNSVHKLLLKIKALVSEIEKIYHNTRVGLSMTKEQIIKHDSLSHCQLCGKKFNNSVKTSVKCADHDHLDGSYRFTCCSSCNFEKLRKPNFVPIFFHNLSGYDSHFIISELHKVDCEIKVIPQTEEKYISFSIKFKGCNLWVRFLDSFRFLPASLEKLVSICQEFPEMERHFPEPQLRKLLLRKGVYPYQYITNDSVLDETTLPSKDKFFNRLTNESITDDDYKHAGEVWRTFNIKNLHEYTLLYLKSDIILLCEVFEGFRKLTYDRFQLDSAWFMTLPGFSFKAALKISKIKLQILNDIDMLQFVELGIRGGITQCIKRHVVANNKYIPETFNPSKESSYIFYGDVNNLYGWAMTQKLPYGAFEWLEDSKNFDVLGTKDDGVYGFFLDVDVSYPKELFDAHSDFPYLPVKRKTPGSKVEKLLLDFLDRKNYVVHLTNLKQAIKAGLKLERINRVLKFKQSDWLAKYINFNTELRKCATSDFEKDFYKLLNNAVFGKTMESKRNRINIQLVRTEKELLKLAKKPNFVERHIYKNKLVSVRLAHEKIVFDKPIYVGLAILELSKWLLYEIHFDHMCAKFGKNINLCYQDTDSFIWEIKTFDLYNDLKSMNYLFDTSDYPPNHDLHSMENKKKIGKLKDETMSVPIKGFVGLRPKLYALKFGDKVQKKAKGVKKSAVRALGYEDYVNTLRYRKDFYTSFQKIGSKLHEVYTFNITKKSLSFNDDKRIILENGVDTRPYGYFESINNMSEESD